MNQKNKETKERQYSVGSLPEIFQQIEQVNRKLKRLQSQTLKKASLSPPQFFTLSLLWEKDGRPFKELADALNCTRATVTGIIDTLEKKGLVVRAPNLGDRRSLLVKLTEKGRSTRSSTPSLEKTFKSCCDGLEPQEINQLSRLLEKLNSSLHF